jgi:hypothetical protein
MLFPGVPFRRMGSLCSPARLEVASSLRDFLEKFTNERLNEEPFYG